MAQENNSAERDFNSITFLSVGAASEAKTRAYRLSLAGEELDRYGKQTDISDEIVKIVPKANSGYSFSMMQNDLGQRNGLVKPIILEAQKWAQAKHFHLQIKDAEIPSFEKELSRQGNFIRGHDHGKPLTPKLRTVINAFLASDEGIAFTHAQDVEQIARIQDNILPRLVKTDLYRNSNSDDQIRLITVTSKLFNQAEGHGRSLLKGIEQGKYHDLSSVYHRIDTMVKREKPNEPTYLETGRRHALAGAETFIALNHAHPDNPLRQKWEHIKQNPLKLPTEIRGQERKDYDEIMSLFFDATHSPKRIRDQDKEFRQKLGMEKAENTQGKTGPASDFSVSLNINTAENARGKAGAAFGFSVSQNMDMVGKLGNKPQEQLAENSVSKQAAPQQEAKREEKNDMASDDNEMSV